MIASPCFAGSGVVCSPIHNNSSDEHLAVFFHIVDNSSPTTADESSFLYFSVAEFKALQDLAQEILRRLAFNNIPTTYFTTNPPPQPVVASDTTSANPNRVYPIVTAPIYQETSS